MKTIKDTLRLSSFDNLLLSIYVIGYKNIGESIIVFFVDKVDNSTFYSILIDCYEQNGTNLSEKIISDHHVKGLNMVFWTHPHRDHTPGLSKLIGEFYQDKMYCFLPKFYYGNLSEDLLKNECKLTPETYKEIQDLYSKNPYKDLYLRTISANGDMTNCYPFQIFTDDGETKNLNFYFLSPLGSRTDQFAIKGKQLHNPNELSISFVMSLDNYDFYFGGDTEKGHAEGIDREIVEDMRWVKVPHHCSNGGMSIAERLGRNIDCAASTVFSVQGLPKKEIQDMYLSKHSRLFMTQLNKGANKDYGIVQFDYNFKKDSITTDITTYGNAGEYMRK